MSSSWFPFNLTLPSLQNLGPPLSIQRRFISFLLKRCLGHLLKPGQLDINQIEAQFGDGVVEVRDLELDNSVCCYALIPFLFIDDSTGHQCILDRITRATKLWVNRRCHNSRSMVKSSFR